MWASEPEALDDTSEDLRLLVAEWELWARQSEARGFKLLYRSTDKDRQALLCDFGQRQEGWPTLHSMRSVWTGRFG